MNKSEEEISEGLDYCGPVKTDHKLFLMDTFKILTKDCPVGYYLVMNSTPRYSDNRPLMVTGYK